MGVNRMLKAAIVGLGGISGAHIPGWKSAEGVELVAVCDIKTNFRRKTQ